jgi:hypothetical protein
VVRTPAGHRRDHLRAVADDALPLDRGPDHEPGHVVQEDQRHVERVAHRDEAGGLVRGVDEDRAAAHLRLVGHDPHDLAVQAAQPDHDLLRPARLDLEERARVDQPVR